MMKHVGFLLFFLFIAMGLVGCEKRDERYYREHPMALQKAIAECPAHEQALVDCETLHQIALQVNDYVYELRMGPQVFGKAILSLQETIAKQTLSHQAYLEPLLEKNRQTLRERLAIVNWLESPVS